MKTQQKLCLMIFRNPSGRETYCSLRNHHPSFTTLKWKRHSTLKILSLIFNNNNIHNKTLRKIEAKREQKISKCNIVSILMTRKNQYSYIPLQMMILCNPKYHRGYHRMGTTHIETQANTVSYFFQISIQIQRQEIST